MLSLLRQEFPDITISKIRFLESQGLVNPERSPSGYRKFYEHDVERLRWVLRQQREHFLPLKVIRDRLARTATIGRARTSTTSTTTPSHGSSSATDVERDGEEPHTAPFVRAVVDLRRAATTSIATAANGSYERRPRTTTRSGSTRPSRVACRRAASTTSPSALAAGSRR